MIKMLDIFAAEKQVSFRCRKILDCTVYIRNCSSEYQLRVNITRYGRQRCSAMQSSACRIWIKARCAPILIRQHSNIATQRFAPSHRFFHLFRVYQHTQSMYFSTYICILLRKSKIAMRFDKRTTSTNNNIARRY